MRLLFRRVRLAKLNFRIMRVRLAKLNLRIRVLFHISSFSEIQSHGHRDDPPLRMPRPMRMRYANSEPQSLRAEMIEGEIIPCHHRDRDRDLERCPLCP